MSQHIFPATTATGQTVCVQAGWDRPLQHYYLVIETVCEQEADETAVFLSDLIAGLSMEAMQLTLQQLSITPPKGYLKEVRLDGVVNVGNKRKHWDSRGHARHQRRSLNLLNPPRKRLLLQKAGYAERFFGLGLYFRGNELDQLIFLMQLAEQYPELVLHA